MSAVMLGFAEPIAADMQPSIEDSHIGGKPRWYLENAAALTPDRIQCHGCGAVMSLLMQLYAPESDLPWAYHRVLYVYLCRRGQCHQQTGNVPMRVFRFQAPESTSIPSTPLAATCLVCGLVATKQCSACRSVAYCSREHQLFHWEMAYHQQLCSKQDSNPELLQKEASALANHGFPCFDILTDWESLEVEPDPSESLTTTLESVELSSTAQTWSSEQFENSRVDVDDAFLKFQKHIRLDPDQILRYARSRDLRDPEPLWVQADDRPRIVPVCERCGSERTFEFQVMPQLLNFLNIHHADPHALDFGTLLVYSCCNSCDGTPGPVEEVIFPQDFSQHGVALEEKKLRFGG